MCVCVCAFGPLSCIMRGRFKDPVALMIRFEFVHRPPLRDHIPSSVYYNIHNSKKIVDIRLHYYTWY